MIHRLVEDAMRGRAVSRYAVAAISSAKLQARPTGDAAVGKIIKIAEVPQHAQ